MLGTPNNSGIVFERGVPQETRELLERAFHNAKAVYGPFEVAVIPLQREDSYNLQIHMSPDKAFLNERISRHDPVADFESVVAQKLGS
jgi:hypothetical protein